MTEEPMHPNFSMRLRGPPPRHPPEPVWLRLESLLDVSRERADYLRSVWGPLVDFDGPGAIEMVRSWHNMATISRLSARQLRRGFHRGHLVIIQQPEGIGHAKLWTPLSCLLRYSRWRHGLRIY